MRTYEEVGADIRQAMRVSDTKTILSLASELDELATPQARALALRARGLTHALRGEFTKALEHFQEALQLFESVNDRIEIATVTGNIGNVYSGYGDYKAAREYYKRTVELFETLGDRGGVAHITGNIGNVDYITGNYADALDNYQSALSGFHEVGDRSGIARVTGNVGIVYSIIGKYEEALSFYSRALELHEELGDRIGVAFVNGNIGSVHTNTGNYPEALAFLSRALLYHEELGNGGSMAVVLGNIGNVHRSIGDYPVALSHYRRALQLHEDLGERSGVARMVGNVGAIHMNTGDYSDAMNAFQRALTLYEEIGEPTGLAMMTGCIGSVHNSLGDHAKALEFYNRALALHKQNGDNVDVTRVTSNIVSAYLSCKMYDEAESTLDSLVTLPIDVPEIRISCRLQRSTLQVHKGQLEAALDTLHSALSEAKERGLRAELADVHKELRDLAQLRNDFAAYIEHNNEYTRINEEIRGKEATQKLAMMEAERNMEAERKERDKERALLYGALPKSIADRMIRGEEVAGDHFDNAAVIFLDIVGFTAHTSHMPPAEVVKMLENIFRTIDGICATHNVVKIKTIGDSYLCFRGDADASMNALSIAHVARDVLQAAFTWPDGSPVQYRIGAHCGPVTAGVIGTERLQYDVWGDTVNVASRMESTGEPGRIHVSEAFAVALGAGVTPRGELEIKGKGLMKTYWLESTI